MTLQNHHAHIFIGNPESSEDLVLEYLAEDGITKETTDFHIQKTNLFTVDDARELKRFVSQKSSDGKNIVAFILTENFSHQAQHALLKTLEEPLSGVQLIFVVPKEHTLLPTLRSRVMVHYLTSHLVVSPIDVALFRNGTIAKRIQLVDDYLKKIKDDEALHEKSRRDALAFLHAYESHLYQEHELAKNHKEFDAVFFAKEYIHDQGSSVKQLLEHVALMK